MARTLPFLLEIGAEEIPDWMIVPALDHLRGAFEKLLADNRLSGKVDWVDATPRRLVLKANGLPAGQADSEEVVSGPPKSAGEGAAQGFARKNGATVDQLETVTTPKGEYFAYRKKIAGRATKDILTEQLPSLILGIPWPKAMYWTTKGSPRFIRPLRWLVTLLGKEVVPVEVSGVVAGEFTQGHRTAAGRKAAGKPIKVSVSNYEAKLAAAKVLVRASERRQRIEIGIAQLLDGKPFAIKPDPALLDTLVYLTEWPTPILGSFSESYLSLPAEVLVTVMRHHQRYFSVENPDGTLAPHFIAVMNVGGDPEGWIVSGNERVLRARFNDARFFWDVDQQKTLRDRVESLAHVTFQAKLGSYLDKTNRVVDLVRALGGDANAERAALLAKTDLTTDMVKEFTELQGVVGGLYARAQGEPEAAARAIYEHYKPVSMEDSIPSTRAGQVAALADKLDTLRECFRVGLIPSGSRDPFALRRAAQGVVKILVEGELDVKLDSVLGGDTALVEFFQDRLRYYFREIRGFAYDEINAAMACDWGQLKDLASRLEALKAVRPTANFEPLAASFKRIRNILKQAGVASGNPVNEALLEEGPERELYLSFQRVREEARESSGYRGSLEKIAGLRPAVDLFFDKVLVNVEDAAVRNNRLALLDAILRESSSIADFSEIVTNEGHKETVKA
ncbi:MAG: glycine--tRNA ligase subunit beta [Bryobacterales bacterium]|nr:glycine--tRNA ligase subunit beta [Bryobacterales bacterium]